MAKIIMITGASSGFGEASARKFAQMEPGCSLVLVARRLDKLKALASELEGLCSVHVAKLDVREKDAIAGFLPSLPEEFQAIDVLVNNAGLALGLQPSHKVDLDDWETMVDTNIKGMMWVTRHILPGMVERDRGHVINIGSIAGDWPYPGGNVYCSTKAFVHQFTRTLRADLVGKRVRATTVAPGMGETNFSNVRMKGDDSKADKVYEGTNPLVAKDIADIIYWVTSVPPHVNINALEVMPTCQAWGPWNINREMDYS